MGHYLVVTSSHKGKEQVVDANKVIQDEHTLISATRKCARPHIALAFSGGGIRSATFNLGILQGLAKLGLLKEVDYLSTVSGGGYVGSWLTAWVKRQSRKRRNGPQAALDDIEKQLAGPDEPPEIQFLRDYSNYLTPRVGLLSSDTLAAVSNLLRNLLLTQTTLILFLFAVLLMPWLIYFIARIFESAWLAGIVGTIFLVHCITRIRDELTSQTQNKSDEQGQVIKRILVPGYLASAFLALALGRVSRDWLDNSWYSLAPMLLGSMVFVLAWGRIVKAGEDGAEQNKFEPLIAPALSGALGGWLFFWIAVGLKQLAPESESVGSIAALGLGAVLVIVAFSLMATLLIGLVGRNFTEADREWWGRLGGWALMIGLAWAFLFTVIVLGPVALIRMGMWLGGGGGLVWLATTAWGVWMARSEQTGDGKSKRWMEFALAFIPYAFVLGLLVLIGLLIQWLVVGLAQGSEFSSILENQMDRISKVNVFFKMALMLIACGGGFWWLDQRLDVNLFSMHHFYHNRLARCYMGASNRRRNASAFTGFDESDEMVYLQECRHRPFHIVNTAMNLVAGKNLGWQQRKAASFAFTPLSVGFEFPGAQTQSYRPTYDGADTGYMGGKTKLSTAMTISGAAASPNMGYHSSPALSFLLTLFNVRLGRWCANPKSSNTHWQDISPKSGGRYLLSELFGQTDETSDFVYLSDGGHFENLGIYELVRRKCRYIIACDAGQDAEVTFEDLGNAVRKCYDDFGVRIDIDARALRPDKGSRFSLQHCVMGKIHYPNEPQEGYLFYIKASLTSDEPIDVLQYAAANAEFPHQSTADQWFDEAQFESYRNLGQHIAQRAFAKAANSAKSGDTFDDVKFFTRLTEQWYAPSHVAGGAFSRHGRTLMKIFELLRKEAFLSCLDGAFYAKSANAGLPSNSVESRQVHYVGNRMIQLMEDVYLDLNLEDEVQFKHPDHQGWVELFKRWTASKALQEVWETSRDTYGQRFRIFCREHFNLN